MKVLVISHMYPSAYNSIYGIFVHEHVKALKEQGCDVKVISPIPLSFFPMTLFKKKWRDYANVPGKSVIDGIEVFYPRYIDFPKSFLFEYSGYFMYLGIKNTIKKIYKDFKFDILHSHVAIPDGYACMLIDREYKVPHVVTIHGQDLLYSIYRSERCKKRLYGVLKNSSRVITVSSKLKNVVKGEDFYNRVTVINNGVDINKTKYISSKGTNKTVLSVSSLIKTKGIDLNIKAMSKLVKKYPDLLYYIIGDGPEKDKLSTLVNELNLNSNVIFVGAKPHDEVMEYMAKSDIFCLPSYEEGFGVVYIEAMLHGKPVIGVKGEGIEDVIRNGENGFLVRPLNVDDIVNTVDFILENCDKAEKMGNIAKEEVIKNYTWAENARKTIALYNELLK